MSTKNQGPKLFMSFEVGMVDYKRHQEQVVAAFSQFLMEYRYLTLNVGSNITLGYPDPGILPQKPMNLISAYIINPGVVSELERKVTESVVVKKVLDPFKKKLLANDPFKNRHDIINAIVLLPIKKEN